MIFSSRNGCHRLKPSKERLWLASFLLPSKYIPFTKKISGDWSSHFFAPVHNRLDTSVAGVVALDDERLRHGEPKKRSVPWFTMERVSGDESPISLNIASACALRYVTTTAPVLRGLPGLTIICICQLMFRCSSWEIHYKVIGMNL